jgi:GTP pyrophosphokinase
MRGDMVFNATITARGIDRKGMLKDVTTLLADIFDIDIHRLSTICDDGIFNSEIELKVKDAASLGEVEEQLSQIDGMQSVHRI